MLSSTVADLLLLPGIPVFGNLGWCLLPINLAWNSTGQDSMLKRCRMEGLLIQTVIIMPKLEASMPQVCMNLPGLPPRGLKNGRLIHYITERREEGRYCTRSENRPFTNLQRALTPSGFCDAVHQV